MKETKRDYVDEEYILTLEQIDSLQMELSTTNPWYLESFKKEIQKLARLFLEAYSGYMPNELREMIGYPDQRVIIIDKKISLLNQLWTPEPQVIHEEQGNDQNAFVPLGFVELEGRFIVVRQYSPDELIRQSGEEIVQVLMDKYGATTREEALDQGVQSVMLNVAAHEVGHLYQDFSLPNRFDERGASFYGREVIKMARELLFSGPDTPSYAFTYKRLIERFGDDVHRVFFGTPTHQYPRDAILQDEILETLA